jgi:hypothetical protein
MPVPTTREEFKMYCLRRLGAPVLQINVDPDQLEDRIDEALLYFWDYHYDGTTKIYSTHQLTQTDIDNKFLTVDPSIISITNIFPLSDSDASINMFDLRYQLRLNELYDFTSASYVNYTLTMEHLRTLELLFTGRVPIRFNRHQSTLYIDWSWGDEVCVGQWVIMEGYQLVDPTTYPDTWNDRWLKQYGTALFKRQWGENLRKFDNVTLPGGVMLNGEKIYQSAIKEISDLEKEMIRKYSLPCDMLMG